MLFVFFVYIAFYEEYVLNTPTEAEGWRNKCFMAPRQLAQIDSYSPSWGEKSFNAESCFFRKNIMHREALPEAVEERQGMKLKWVP